MGEPTTSSNARPRLAASRWLIALGIAALVPNAALAARLVWEQTALTWRQGPQMVGFSLSHGLWAPLIVSPILLLALGVWLIAVMVRGLMRGLRPGVGLSALMASTLLLGAVLLAPYAMWEQLFAGRLMTSAHAADFVINAAALGERRTLTTFLAHGGRVDLVDRDSTTALHAAAVENHPEMIEFLLAHGASLNAIDRFGDSPLQSAIESKSQDAARDLQAHGAQRIQGTEERRAQVSSEDVTRDIARMDSLQRAH